MKLIKSQTLFVQGKNRITGGNPWNFEISIPEKYIMCDNEDIIQITLMNYSTYRSWYTLNTGYNTIAFKNMVSTVTTNITIPAGNYSYKNLATMISSLYPSTTCTWNVSSNKLKFVFVQNHELSFPDQSYQILGFNQGAVVTGTTITSQNVLKPTTYDHICIHLKNVTPHMNFNLDNNQGIDMKVSDILLAMPVTSQPFDLLVWRNYNNEFPLYIKEKKLSSLRFWFTDYDNNLLTYIPDCQMSIRVDTYRIKDDDNESMKNALNDINKFMKLSFLSQNLEK